MQPLDLQETTVPHLKDLIHISNTPISYHTEAIRHIFFTAGVLNRIRFLLFIVSAVKSSCSCTLQNMVYTFCKQRWQHRQSQSNFYCKLIEFFTYMNEIKSKDKLMKIAIYQIDLNYCFSYTMITFSTYKTLLQLFCKWSHMPFKGLTLYLTNSYSCHIDTQEAM